MLKNNKFKIFQLDQCIMLTHKVILSSTFQFRLSLHTIQEEVLRWKILIISSTQIIILNSHTNHHKLRSSSRSSTLKEGTLCYKVEVEVVISNHR
jgi:hypothetical protein